MARKAPALVWGDVTIGAPLVGATLGLYDLQGRLLHAEEATTRANGAFSVMLPATWHHAGPLRLVATGGRLHGEPFAGCVLREIDRIGTERFWRMNALSTSLAALRARDPQLSATKARALLARALRCPPSVELARALDRPGWTAGWFDPQTWLAQAREAPDFDAFLDGFVADVRAGRERPMQEVRMLRGGWDAVVGWAISGVASGMLSWAGGQLAGGLFSLLGGDDTADKLDRINDRLDAIDKTLASTQQELARVDRLQVEALARLQALSDQVAQGVGDLLKETRWRAALTQLRGRLSMQDQALDEHANMIASSFEGLVRFAKCDPQSSPWIRQLAREQAGHVLAVGSGIETQLRNIHETLVGRGTESYLAGFAELMSMTARDEAGAHQVAAALASRVEQLLGLELVGMAMVFDAFLCGPHPAESMAADFRATWLPRLQAQVQAYLQAVEQFAASRIDGATGSAFGCGRGLTPSETLLQRADRLAGQIGDVLAWPRGEARTAACRVTLRVVNYPQVTGHDLPATMQLRLQGEAGAPQAATRCELRRGATVADRELSSLPYQLLVARFDLPPGSYRVDAADASVPAGALRPRDCAAALIADEAAPHVSQGLVAWRDLVRTEHVRRIALPPSRTGAPGFADQIKVQAGACLHALYPRSAEAAMVSLDTGKGSCWAGQAPDEFHAVLGLDVDGDSLWIADQATRSVRRWQPGQPHPQQTLDTAKRPLKGPMLVAVGAEGWVHVVDEDGSVCVYSPAEGFVGEVATGVKSITGLGVDGDGAIYVVDPGAQTVLKYRRSGQAHGAAWAACPQWAAAASRWPTLRSPVGLAVDRAAGWVYVSCQLSGRLYRFSQDGVALGWFGSLAECKTPGALAVDPDSGAVLASGGGSQYVEMWAGLRVSRNW